MLQIKILHAMYVIVINCYEHKPAFKTIVEICVVCAEDKNNVKPAFGKEITAMVINYDASVSHFVLQFIHNLEYWNCLYIGLLCAAYYYMLFNKTL